MYVSKASGVEELVTRRVYAGGYEREENADGSIVKEKWYIGGGNGIAAIKNKETSGSTTEEFTHFVHTDHLGSIHSISDELGNLPSKTLDDGQEVITGVFNYGPCRRSSHRHGGKRRDPLTWLEYGEGIVPNSFIYRRGFIVLKLDLRQSMNTLTSFHW